jgi:uncharacterized protein YdiU (UPF0061 family)
VLVRLQHSHIRFGTFQRLAFFERPDLMRALVDHCIEAYYPWLADTEGEARAGALFGAAVENTARLAASWMAAGFVHGVLNTDNLNITGESFDYGPWRFLPASDPSFTAAYFDEAGLYAFGRQPEAVSWALSQFGGALSLISPVPALEAGLGRFAPAYQRALVSQMFARLKLEPGDEAADLDFLQGLFDWLTQTGIGWEQFFHDWIGGDYARAKQSPQAARYEEAGFAPVRSGIEARAQKVDFSHLYLQQQTPVSLVIDEVEALWTPIAERDDWAMFEAKLAHIAQMRQALALPCHGPVASAG